MTLPPNKALAEALRSEIENLRRLQQEAADEQRRFGGQALPSVHDLRGVASVLSDIYEGAEKAFERIVRVMGESLPSGFDWHQKLLTQMSEPVAGQRPAVIRPETQQQLDDFRRFRHVERHRYGFELDWQNIRVLLADSDQALNLLTADLESLCLFLEQLDKGEE
ncbi:MAG TPA: hypothetical protein VI547_05455 [Anaerolineales bacterium]|nr:hypothetical protein [Anaerolineales bacterium]